MLVKFKEEKIKTMQIEDSIYKRCSKKNFEEIKVKKIKDENFSKDLETFYQQFKRK